MSKGPRRRALARQAFLACLACRACALLVTGCVEPAAPLHASTAPGETSVSLAIEDYLGDPVEPLSLPRRPRLRVRAAAPLDPADEQIWLLRGAVDSDLLSDLERSPLLADHRARSVPCAIAELPDGLELVPLAALDRGAELAFVLAAWATTAEGERLGLEAPLVLDLRTRSDAEAGAGLTGSWPADGSSSVGTDLPAALIAFDGKLLGAEQGVWLEGPDRAAVEVHLAHGACAKLAPELTGNECVSLAPSALLAPLSEHAIVVGSGATDALGAPVGPIRIGFRTGSGPDRTPPTLIQDECAIDELPFDELCALLDDHRLELRVRADEPFVATLTHERERVVEAAPAALAVLQLELLEPGKSYDLELELRDGTGNRTARSLQVTTPADLPTLSITELRADPRGPEPAQEAIEVLNYGDRSIALQGISVSDQARELGQPIASTLQLDPGARALLVPDGFDPLEASDSALPPGAQLVRVGRALGTSGLANRGEAVFLRDALGRRLSAAPATPRPMAGVCSVRVSEDPRSGEAGSFELDAAGGCTLGQ